MKLLINHKPCGITCNTADEYLAACREIDHAINSKRNISISSSNAVVIRWLIAMYEKRCTVILGELQ